MKKYSTKKTLSLNIAKNEKWVEKNREKDFTYSSVNANWKKMICELSADEKISLIFKYALEGNKKLVKLLYESSGAEVDLNTADRDNNNALMFAVKSGQKEVVEYLLTKNVNADYRNILGFSPLHLAVRKNQIELVKLLNKYGANLEIEDKLGQSPIFEAVIENNCKMINTIFQNGGDINHKNKLGITPLMIASFNKNRQEVLNQILECGADVNVVDNLGRNAFMHACNNNNGAMMDILLKAKSRFNIQDKKGNTALMICAKRGNREGVRVLISKGANVFKENDNGQKASDIACALGYKGCAEILKKAENIYLESVTDESVLSTLKDFAKHNRMENSCIQ